MQTLDLGKPRSYKPLSRGFFLNTLVLYPRFFRACGQGVKPIQEVFGETVILVNQLAVSRSGNLNKSPESYRE